MSEKACCTGMNTPNMVVWWSYCPEHDQHRTEVFGGSASEPAAREHRKTWGPFEAASEIAKYLHAYLQVFADQHTKQQSLH